jgi:hypothetical protein
MVCSPIVWSFKSPIPVCCRLGEEHNFRVFENRVLRRIYEPKWDEISEGWRKFHDELHNLYSTRYKDDQVKDDEMVEACRINRYEKCT